MGQKFKCSRVGIPGLQDVSSLWVKAVGGVSRQLVPLDLIIPLARIGRYWMDCTVIMDRDRQNVQSGPARGAAVQDPPGVLAAARLPGPPRQALKLVDA